MEDSRPWSHPETGCLIALWSDSAVQAQLDCSYRNRRIYEDISKQMEEHGWKRSWLQCQRKVKRLKVLYHKAKDNVKKRITCPFFEDLDRILCERPMSQHNLPIDVCDIKVMDPDSDCDTDSSSNEKGE